jgi:hypothetical protein
LKEKYSELAVKVFLTTIFLFSENAALNAEPFGIMVLGGAGLLEDAWYSLFFHGNPLLFPCSLNEVEIGPGFNKLLIVFS